MDPLTRILVVVLSALSGAVGLANGSVTTVTLRATVRLSPDQRVTLGAIAEIVGDQSDRLGALTLDTPVVGAGSWSRLDAGAVREAIAGSSAMEGSVVVVGHGVSLTRVVPRAEHPAVQPVSAPAEGAPGTAVREHLTSWLRARFDAAPDDIRVVFDARDDDFLNTPTDGRQVEVVEIGMSGRIALRVNVYERDTIVASESLRIGVEVRRDAWIADRPLRRGSTIGPDDGHADTIWCDPTDPPTPPGDAIGLALKRTVQPGTVLRPVLLETPLMVERGRDVSVRSIRGSVVVTTIARARADARLGELVELEAKDRSGRRFTARVAGPGRAVLIDPAATEQATPETNEPPISGAEENDR